VVSGGKTNAIHFFQINENIRSKEGIYVVSFICCHNCFRHIICTLSARNVTHTNARTCGQVAKCCCANPLRMTDVWNRWVIRCPQTLGFCMIQGQRTSRLRCGSSLVAKCCSANPLRMADACNSWAIRCPQTLGFRMIQGQRTARLRCGSSSRLRTRRWGGAARGRRTRRRRIARCRRLRGSDWWGGPPCGERPKHQARRTTRQGAALAGGLAATNLAIVIHAASPMAFKQISRALGSDLEPGSSGRPCGFKEPSRAAALLAWTGLLLSVSFGASGTLHHGKRSRSLTVERPTAR
jgi:hypothetical protein